MPCGTPPKLQVREAQLHSTSTVDKQAKSYEHFCVNKVLNMFVLFYNYYCVDLPK